MGRIHRYGQKHDPVIILNLVAPKTREGRVTQDAARQAGTIRKELGSDKVFDVIGRVFEGVSIKQYMEMAVADDQADDAAKRLDGSSDQRASRGHSKPARRSLYGTGGDVANELPRLRDEADRELYRRLLPGYVRQYVESAAPFLDIEIDGDSGQCFAFQAKRRAAADPLLQPSRRTRMRRGTA